MLETDASDYAIGSIISQEYDGFYHPIAYHSRKLSNHELNYDVYDKELLAIVDSFRKFRTYLIASPQEIIVQTDHNNLVKFGSAQQLNRRQFRWAQYLSEFNFKIIHRPGKLSEKPDALSRKEQYSAINKQQNYLQLFQKIELDEQLSINLIKLFNLNASPTQTLNKSLTQTTVNSNNFLEKIKEFSTPFINDDKYISNYEIKNGIFYKDSLIVLPMDNLRIEMFQSMHNSPTAGHYGLFKTLELIQRKFYWLGMKRDVAKFIKSCHVCTRNKSARHKKYGLLQPLPIPKDRWINLSMDFITDLPICQGFDSVFIVKDRLTKQAHFLPCNKTINAEQTADLFIKEIVRLHGLPKSIVSDRGPQFKSTFFWSLFNILGIQTTLSTTAHPETDGSTEVLNQMFEQYIRIYGNTKQSDWVTHLPLAEFTYNNTKNSTTGFSPFYSNYGYNPRMDFLDIETPNPSSNELATHLKDILLELKDNLMQAQINYSYFANKTRLPTPSSFTVGASVFLNRKNISPKYGIKKFSQKFFGPYKIIEQINPVSFRLDLPSQLPIHPVFHVSLLEPATTDAFPNQNPVPQPVLVDDVTEYEVDSVLKVRGKGKRKRYFVHWKNTDESENTWEPISHLKHCKGALDLFHAHNKKFNSQRNSQWKSRD